MDEDVRIAIAVSYTEGFGEGVASLARQIIGPPDEKEVAYQGPVNSELRSYLEEVIERAPDVTNRAKEAIVTGEIDELRRYESKPEEV